MKRLLLFYVFLSIGYSQCDANDDGILNILDIIVEVDCILTDCWILEPEAISIYFTTSSNGGDATNITVLELGDSLSIYAQSTYNEEVILPFDYNEYPIATFTNPTNYILMSGGNGAYTSSSVLLYSDSEGDISSVNWLGNGVQEDGVVVSNSASADSIIWRNNRIAGAGFGVPSDSVISNPYYEELANFSGSDYNDFTVTVNIPAGGKAWFGMPPNYSAGAVYISGINQIGGFSITERIYTNTKGIEKAYKIYYLTNAQAESSITMDIDP